MFRYQAKSRLGYPLLIANDIILLTPNTGALTSQQAADNRSLQRTRAFARGSAT
jgi:hypothetical protein